MNAEKQFEMQRSFGCMNFGAEAETMGDKYIR